MIGFIVLCLFAFCLIVVVSTLTTGAVGLGGVGYIIREIGRDPDKYLIRDPQERKREVKALESDWYEAKVVRGLDDNGASLYCRRKAEQRQAIRTQRRKDS